MPGYVIRHRRHSPAKWKYHKVYSLAMDDSLEWVRWIERHVIGQVDPFVEPDPEEQSITAQDIKMSFEYGAALVGLEQGWRTKITADNVEKVAKYTAYHIGFPYRPDHRNCSKALFKGEHNASEKFVVGSSHFLKTRPEHEIKNQIKRINRNLTYARIVGHEKIFAVAERRDEERTLCYPVYHLGFKHKLS